MASILELGSGFHPEFTGRQNIVLNAAMLGLSQEELQRKMPDIVAFSELGDFIDQPVKTYSTGMAMRLGFSIATQVEPDVLIIDEALSVGDGYFQKKCMDRLRVFVDSRRHAPLLLARHVLRLGLLPARALAAPGAGRGAGAGLRGGAGVREFPGGEERAGGAEESPAGAAAAAQPCRRASPRRGSRPDAATDLLYTPGDPWELEVAWEAEDPRLAFHLGVGINRADGIEVCSFATHLDGLPPVDGGARHTARLAHPQPAFGEGGVHPVYFPPG